MFAKLLREDGKLDIALILIAIADDERVALALLRDHDMELWLGAGLKTEVELAAVRSDLIDHGLHLVHLDRIDHIALAFEVILFLGFLIARRHLLDTVIENVGEAQEHRRRDITQRKVVHQFAQVDLDIVLHGRHVDMSLLIDAKVRGTPSLDVVELLRVFYSPLFHYIPNSLRIASTVIFIFSRLSMRVTSMTCLALL